MVERMVAVTRDIADHDPDLELQLMLVVERFAELVGTRGGARSYTLRFGGEGVDLLVRVGVSEEEGRARLDGWLVPGRERPRPDPRGRRRGPHLRRRWPTDSGRFEFPDLPTGFYRVSLKLADEPDVRHPCVRDLTRPHSARTPHARPPQRHASPANRGCPIASAWLPVRREDPRPVAAPVVDESQREADGVLGEPADDRQGGPSSTSRCSSSAAGR